MPISDQQLRQDLLGFGETVPPITQRNREQLRARLELLRSHPRTRSGASPSRSRAAASPSRPLLSGSPSGSRVTASPTRTRSTASPARSALTSSPSRTRAATNTSTSRPTTRSKPAPGLIELSDSETDSSSADYLMSRSVGTGHVGPNVQTRSIAFQRQHESPSSLSSSGGISGPSSMTNDVELSIARHRREIKQLLDSAHKGNRATTTSISAGQNERTTTPIRPNSPSSGSKPRHSSGSDDDKIKRSPKSDDDKHKRSPKFDDEDDDKHKRSSKSDDEKSKKLSSLKNVGKPIQKFWKKYTNILKNILKALVVASLLFGGLIFLLQKSGDLFPHREAINCTAKDVIACQDMNPVIAAVRKQLQIRTGEVDCGFRPKTDILVKKAEIEQYLNEKGLKFNLGSEERWKALITYIFQKPDIGILVWNQANQQTKDINAANKLSTPEAIHSLTCRAKQGVDYIKTIKHLGLLLLGSTGLLTLAWYLQRQSKQHEENEQTYKSILSKATDLIKDQYEQHLRDPQKQAGIAISHIRDKLIPEADQDRLKNIWERVKKEISKQDTRIRSETQTIRGEVSDVWEWIKSASSSPKKTQSEQQPRTTTNEDSYVYTSSETGLTECLKLRNFFGPDNCADDEEIDLVVDSIQNRCASVKRIEHIGIHSVFVYLKFSSKEAAAQGYHLLNNWNYHGREINAKYVRLNRYYEHFPEARDISTNN